MYGITALWDWLDFFKLMLTVLSYHFYMSSTVWLETYCLGAWAMSYWYIVNLITSSMGIGKTDIPHCILETAVISNRPQQF